MSKRSTNKAKGKKDRPKIKLGNRGKLHHPSTLWSGRAIVILARSLIIFHY